MKVAIINCYSGKLPNYFELWLQSCAYNNKVDFILFTDCEVSYKIPNNVHIHKTSLDELKKIIQSKFDFNIVIESPYKLTDFKPAYGYIFEELLKGYHYWGYCDVDLIFGNLMKFIEAPMEQGIEKIYRLGHLTIYKNNEKMKNLFRQKGAPFLYKEVFSSPEFYSFDEHAGQMSIARHQGIKEYYKEDMADISCRIKRLTASRHKNYPLQLFYYEDGAVFRAYIENGKVKINEYVYIHIQKRKYKYDEKYSCFYILSDCFINKIHGTPDEKEIKQLSEYISDEIDEKQLKAYKMKKKKEFYGSSIKEKLIWIRIKIAELKFK